MSLTIFVNTSLATDIHSSTCKSTKQTSIREWKDLNELKDGKTITINEANKCSAVVLLNMEYYENLVLSIWEDEAYYERARHCNKPNLNNLRKLINEYEKDSQTRNMVTLQISSANFLYSMVSTKSTNAEK